MKNLFYIAFLFSVWSSCTKPSQTVSTFEQFDAYFSDTTLQDTIHDLSINWSYDDSTNIIPDSIFFTAIDTSKLKNKNWDERQFALFKWKISHNIVAYFTCRHFVDHDQSTLMLLYDIQKKAFVADYVISEFIGYEGFIYDRSGWIFRDKIQQLTRVMVDHTWAVSPTEGVKTDSTSKLLYYWDNEIFWQQADSTILQNFNFPN